MTIKTHARALVEAFMRMYQEDAKAVFEQMQYPTVLRLRAEAAEQGDHPLLAMRIDHMNTLRQKMKLYASSLIEGEPPLDTPTSRVRMKRDMQRSLDVCAHVLECSDDDRICEAVAAHAYAVSESMSLIATILDARPGAQEVADFARAAAIQAHSVAENVDTIARAIKAQYNALQLRVTEFAPRSAPDEIRAPEHAA